jgi:uncharacterized iron-regulated membrane protein
VNFFRQFLHRPQRLWVRQLNFQVHLWVGIILSLYMIVIGVTGAILVFRVELEALSGLKPWHSIQATGPPVELPTVIRNVQEQYPRARITTVFTPTEGEPIAIERKSEWRPIPLRARCSANFREAIPGCVLSLDFTRRC